MVIIIIYASGFPLCGAESQYNRNTLRFELNAEYEKWKKNGLWRKNENKKRDLDSEINLMKTHPMFPRPAIEKRNGQMRISLFFVNISALLTIYIKTT